ncbi:MAG TPA: hypothetical protein QGH09_05170 [Vicinamibacterales bacterium]|nr:hypothetical protein [Vicinamibacterales bacterium]
MRSVAACRLGCTAGVLQNPAGAEGSQSGIRVAFLVFEQEGTGGKKEIH